MAYYNESDPFAAEWLRRLASAGKIASGVVDGRSIAKVRPGHITSPRAHFFAGIGGWDLALQLAGWPDDMPVWTGSCPCQPFSQAGSRRGTDDRRHLWPLWFRLIRECRPSIVFGEQVAGAAGLNWLDLVCLDLEGEGYAVGAADLAAASVGAPHKRQRLYWVAYDAWATPTGRMAHAADRRPSLLDAEQGEEPGDVRPEPHARRKARRVGNAGGYRAGQHARELSGDESLDAERSADRRDPPEPSGLASDPWARAEWIDCSDGVRRPVEPGSFPLAHGVPNRVGKLRGFGNAIVPPLAAEFVRAAMTAIGVAVRRP